MRLLSIGTGVWLLLCPALASLAQEMTPDEVVSKYKEAVALHNQGKFAEAAAMYEQILPASERLFGKGGANTSVVLNNLAVAYQNAGQLQKAEPLFLRCLAISEAAKHPDLHLALINVGEFYRKAGQYAKAEPLYKRALEVGEAKFGKDHVDVAAAVNLLANLYIEMGQHAKAEPLYRRALAIREVKLGSNHPAVAESLNNLGILFQVQGDYARAQVHLERALAIRKTSLGDQHLDTAASYHNLGALQRIRGDYAAARINLEKDLAIRLKLLGEQHADTASSLNSIAVLLSAQGKPAEARICYDRALAIYKKVLGDNHPHTLVSLNNLGVFLQAQGDYPAAQRIMEQVLAARIKVLGERHPDTATSLFDLGSVLKDQKEYPAARASFDRALAIRKKAFGDKHPSTAECLNNLALLLQEQGYSAEAGRHLEMVLEVDKQAYGLNHPQTATAFNNLGSWLADRGDYAAARANQEQALAICKRLLGDDHPSTANCLNNLASSWASQKQWTKAVDSLRLVRPAIAKHMARVLPALSEKEQLTLLQSRFNVELYWGLSVGWTARKQATAASAEWLLNGKAVAHQALAEQQILARNTKDPQAKQLVDLRQTRSRLAALINRAPAPGMEKEYQQEIHDLKTREQDLAQKLAHAIGRPYRANPWVALDELRAKLGPKTAFVDIARFPVYDFNTNSTIGLRYVAWITPPGKGEVQLIDLGAAEPIDQLVEQTRKTLLDSTKSITKIGEIEAFDVLQQPLKELSAKVLHPLLPTLEKYDEWIVCPDGALWLTPWNALVMPDGKFTVEKHLIRHVVSGRDLVLELPIAKADTAWIFADPDYDLSPGKVLAASGVRGLSGPGLLGQRLKGSIGAWNVSFEFLVKEVLIRDEDGQGAVAGKGTWKLQGNSLTIQTSISTFQATMTATEIRGQRSKANADGTIATDSFRLDRPRGDGEEFRSIGSAHTILPKVARLPGTALEAEAIRPKLEQWLQREPKLFLEAQASETTLKSVKNARVLTLATHGYFLPRQEVEAKERLGLETSESNRPLIDKAGQPIENPLLRRGLLLAGCNRRTEAKPGEDDGILTGLEIVGLDLNGCELVVLSACETGLGDVRSGEGVAGLRQAFQLAGAKSVLASLWQVPDRDTALLMNTFYGELTKGRSQAEALRAAQLQRLTSRRQQFGAAHPFFWAAFALTSRGQ